MKCILVLMQSILLRESVNSNHVIIRLRDIDMVHRDGEIYVGIKKCQLRS